jgi:hypothetical protein
MVVMKKSVLVIALAMAFPAVFPLTASAQTTQELKAELDALKLHVKKLEAMIEKVGADSAKAGQAATAHADDVVDPTAFNLLQAKTEALEDANEANGFKGLKFSGYIDPTYIYNRNAKTSSFVFLNNNSSINGSEEVFGYDNTYFGSAFFTIEKELEGGTLVKLTLAPSKSTGSAYNFGNLVHEASVSVPLDSPDTRLLAGQLPDWTGYEAIASNQNALITHNLLFDFSAPTFYTGVGLEFIRGNWDIKTFIGNLNSARINVIDQETPGLFYRGDYSYNEFGGFGFSGVHSGFDDKDVFGRLDLLEVDGYYARGDWGFQGQLMAGRQKATPYNGYSSDQATWYGLSGLASYKFTPRLEGVARFDYINNSKNGGGLLGSAFGGTCLDSTGADANCPDGVNGFGSGLIFDGTSWVVADPTKGSNRSALSLGLRYALLPGVSLKAEYRYDRSSGNTFLDYNGDYRRDNYVWGFSTVISF